MDNGRPAYFDNLSVEGWFWELVRRDGRFRKRFGQIEQAVQAYAASRLSPEEYMAALKSYLAHLRRYGLRTVSLPGPEVPGRPLSSGSHLLLPLPGKGRVLAVPRPDVAYADFGEGLEPVPLTMDRPRTWFSRARIRKLLMKYDLLEKVRMPEEPA